MYDKSAARYKVKDAFGVKIGVNSERTIDLCHFSFIGGGLTACPISRFSFLGSGVNGPLHGRSLERPPSAQQKIADHWLKPKVLKLYQLLIGFVHLVFPTLFCCVG